MTGLFNRAEFEKRLSQAMESAKQSSLQHALLYLDLDQFKIVNDTCGHVAGDELLRHLTGLLLERVRDNDTLARLGGDEFGVLLENCPLDQALRIADAFRESIQDFRFAWHGKTFNTGVSIGVVPIDGESGTFTQVLSAADAACYAAKDKGRNRVHVYPARQSGPGEAPRGNAVGATHLRRLRGKPLPALCPGSSCRWTNRRTNRDIGDAHPAARRRRGNPPTRRLPASSGALQPDADRGPLGVAHFVRLAR